MPTQKLPRTPRAVKTAKPAPVTIEVLEVVPATDPKRRGLLARGRIRVRCGSLALESGPWKIVRTREGKLVVYAPSSPIGPERGWRDAIHFETPSDLFGR